MWRHLGNLKLCVKIYHKQKDMWELQIIEDKNHLPYFSSLDFFHIILSD